MLQWSDRTLLFSVQSDGVPMSGRAKMMETGSTRLWLCPVSCDRTRPVIAPGDLDLSGVDRTLGGSVRLSPPERSVSRNRVGFQLFLVSYSITGDPPYNQTVP